MALSKVKSREGRRRDTAVHREEKARQSHARTREWKREMTDYVAAAAVLQGSGALARRKKDGCRCRAGEAAAKQR